jgi:hypothetical protein
VVSLGIRKSQLLCSSQRPDIVFKVSNVIFNPLYFRELYFNNFLFVYSYSTFTNNLREGRLDFPVLFYAVTNFRKTRHSHVISWGIFAPRLVRIAPLEAG